MSINQIPSVWSIPRRWNFNISEIFWTRQYISKNISSRKCDSRICKKYRCEHTVHCSLDAHWQPGLADKTMPIEDFRPLLPRRSSLDTTQRQKTLSPTSFERRVMTIQRLAICLTSTLTRRWRRELTFWEVSVSWRVMLEGWAWALARQVGQAASVAEAGQPLRRREGSKTVVVQPKKKKYSGDQNSKLVRYLNGLKQFAGWMVCYSSHDLNSKLEVRYSLFRS